MEIGEAQRVRLSAQPDTAPDILRALAADTSVTVRATLALNPAAPGETNARLARDPDERVRTLLARKLGSLAPGLSDDARIRLNQETFDTLTALAGDEAVRVRVAIAEAVKDLPDVPRSIILRLAHDEAIMVCEPVILFSPMLSTNDLLSLIAAAPSSGTRLAVARRPGIDEAVSDALVSHGTDDVIQALLMNESAQIREAVLDVLTQGCAGRTAWHEPLARRPALSVRAVKALSETVANHLLEVLAARSDLDPGLAAELREKVNARLGKPNGEAHAGVDAAKPTEPEILDAVRQGDGRKAAELLAAAAEVPLALVQRAATLRSAKGLVSLCWKAGFTMNAGHAVQVLLGRLSPGTALKSGPGNSFPLSVQEMRWQLDFLGGAPR